MNVSSCSIVGLLISLPSSDPAWITSSCAANAASGSPVVS